MKKILLTTLTITVVHFMYSQNVGIGTTTPRAPLSFPPSPGQKIILWDDGNVNGDNYGIGIQSGVMQFNTYTSVDNFSFGYGRSSSLTERMRIINSGEDGLLVNGRILLKNGTLPNDPAQGPGIWLYKPDNLGQLLGFMGAQNNQNIGFYGGPAEWGFTYNTINSRVGINTPNPTSLLNVNGQVTIDQKNFGGYGGLLLKGNVPGSNHPNIAFTIKNNAPTPADVVGAMIQGDLLNNSANVESIDLTFLTANSGFGSLSEKFRIKGNGALAVNTNTGTLNQILSSNGPSAAATWVNAGAIIKTGVSGVTSGIDLIGLTTYSLDASTYVVTLDVPSRVIMHYKTVTYKNCSVGSCDTKWHFNVFINGIVSTDYKVNASSYGAVADYGYSSGSFGPDYFDLPAGTHTFTFNAWNMFNNPRIHQFLATTTIIAQ